MLNKYSILEFNCVTVTRIEDSATNASAILSEDSADFDNANAATNDADSAEDVAAAASTSASK